MNFISDGLWACIGALIGAAIGGLTTYTISQRTIKLELRKIHISFLIEKLRKLESIKSKYDINYPQTIDSEDIKTIIHDYVFFSKTLNDFSHYLSNSTYYVDAAKEYDNILLEETQKTNNDLEIYYCYKSFNSKMDALIKYELKQTVSKIEKLIPC